MDIWLQIKIISNYIRTLDLKPTTQKKIYLGKYLFASVETIINDKTLIKIFSITKFSLFD